MVSMKKLVIIFAVLSFLPCSALATGYEVSANLTFLEPPRFVTVWEYLHDQMSVSIGTGRLFCDQGDYLKPVDLDPNNISALNLQYLERFLDPNKQKNVFDYMEAQKVYIDQNQPGKIEKHDCHGDTPPRPCEHQAIDSWGGEE